MGTRLLDLFVFSSVWVACAAAAGGSGLLAWRQTPPVWGLLAAVLVLGLLHRRLKHVPFLKGAYLIAAWLGVVVGVPALASHGAAGEGWVIGVVGGALGANVIASNLRAPQNAAGQLGQRAALATAAAFALGAAVLAFLGSPSVWPLAAVPLATLASLLAFRPGERYGLVVVDGALLVGALAALALSHPLCWAGGAGSAG